MLAQDEKESERTADIRKLEQISLSDYTPYYKWKSNPWRGSHRENIVYLLENTPAYSDIPAVQKLILDLLLSGFNTTGMIGESDIKEGRDFLTLRIGALMRGGAYDKALALYSERDDAPYSEALARQGVLAMLYTRQKSLACLETKSLSSDLKTQDFWSALDAYCDETLTQNEEKEQSEEKLAEKPEEEDTTNETPYPLLQKLVKNKEFTFSYNTKAFAKLKPLEKATLVSEGKLVLGTETDIKDIPVSDLMLLLQQDSLAPQKNLAILARAAGYYLVDAKTIRDFYIAQTTPAAGSDSNSTELNLKEGPVWKALSKAYVTLSNEDTPKEEYWDIIRTAYEISEPYGLGTLIPMAPYVLKSKIESPKAADVLIAHKILRAAGEKIPSHWQIEPENTPMALAVSNYYALPAYSRTAQKKAKIVDSKDDESLTNKKFYFNVIENIDKADKNIDNAAKVYEKDLILTNNRDYVMPSVSVWDGFIQATQENTVAEAVLLSTVLLRDHTTQSAHPKLVRDVLQGFENVGFEKVTEDMVTKTALGW